MSMVKFTTFAALVAVAAVSLLAIPPLPRKSPEFTILEPPSGKQTLLSTAKGKVCVIEFLHTTCPHCQHESEIISKLYNEMKARGFQAFGVAFNDNAAM